MYNMIHLMQFHDMHLQADHSIFHLNAPLNGHIIVLSSHTCNTMHEMTLCMTSLKPREALLTDFSGTVSSRRPPAEL